MDANSVIALVALAFSFMGMVVYVSVRFAKVEAEIENSKVHQDDFKTVRDMVYEIRAQNQVLLTFKQSSQL